MAMNRSPMTSAPIHLKRSPYMADVDQMPTITLEVISPDGAQGPIRGFNSPWVKYVKGFDHTTHCQDCLRGSVVQEASGRRLAPGHPIALDRMREFPYVYVCGVGAGPETLRHERNLHFPLEYAPGETAEVQTHNGYRIRAHNAVALPIPRLESGWNGLPDVQVKCKNFQFAVSAFGYPPRAKAHG